MLWWLAACRHDDPLEIGAFTVELDADHGAFSIRGPDGARLDDVRLLSGTGDATIEVSFDVTAVHMPVRFPITSNPWDDTPTARPTYRSTSIQLHS